MNIHHCCEVSSSSSRFDRLAARTTSARSHPPTFARRCLDVAGWVIPSAVLAFIPKCPACFAAYLAIGTGLGISITTAANLRMLLIVLSIGLLLFLVARHAHRILIGRRTDCG
jgi:hypothetical protein